MKSGEILSATKMLRRRCNAFIHTSCALLGIAAICRAQDASLHYNWVNVTALGAVGDGMTDDTNAIELAINQARSLKSGAVYIPSGSYLYSTNISINGVPVYGQGMTSTKLVAKDGGHSAWILSGQNAVLSDVAISSLAKPTFRNTSDLATGVATNKAVNFLIQRVSVGPVFSAGIIIRSSSGTASAFAKIRDCLVASTMADGIHITGKSQYIEVSNNRVSGTGDDMVAVVSYHSDGGICHDINIFNNVLSDQKNGRVISVVGGNGVSIENNQITRSAQAGIYLASEASYDTYGVNTVSLINNTLTNVVTNAAGGQGAIHMIGRTRLLPSPDLQVASVVAIGNKVNGASADGFAIGSYSSGINLVGNQIANIAGDGIYVHAAVSNVFIGSGKSGEAPNTITASGQHGIFVDPTSSSGTLRITGVVFSDLNTRSMNHIDGIYIGRTGGFKPTEITYNQLKQEAGGHLTLFVESLSPVQEFMNNSSDIPITNFLAQ